MGTFYVSKKHDDSWKDHVARGEIPPWWEKVGDNKIVRGGAAWLEDLSVGADVNWVQNRIGYMAAGGSTNTNQGIVGPSDGVPVPDDGTWQGVSSLDFALSDELVRAPINATRTGDVLVLGAVFSGVGFTVDTEIRELGIFLDGEDGGSNRAPTDNPFDSEVERPFAMIARSVRFIHDTDEEEYQDNPLVNAAGENLELFYSMRFA